MSHVNRTALTVLAALTLVAGRLPASAQTSPSAPGAPGSGILTGDAAPSLNDLRALLQVLVGLAPPTPLVVEAADLNLDGQLGLGDAILLLRVVVGQIPLPKRPTAGPTAPFTLPLLSAWYDDRQVGFVATDDSDAGRAKAMNLNLAPSLAKILGSQAVKPIYYFFTESGGQLTPVPGQLPVLTATPLKDDYTPYWQVKDVVVAPGYKANSLTVDDAITSDPGPGKGGSVVRIDTTQEVIDAPVVYDSAAGPAGNPYILPLATFSADLKSVSLPTEAVLYDGKTFMMVAPETSDAQDQAADHNTLAPIIEKADSGAINFYDIEGPSGPTQPAVLSAAPEPIGPTSANADYTPVWRYTKVQWAAAVTSPPMLKSDDDVKGKLASGDLKILPGSFVFNCPIVAEASVTPPPPAPVAVSMAKSTFSPKDFTVPVGTTVTWTNGDSFGHTVTSGPAGQPDGMFDSKNVAAKGTFSFTFTKAGTYPYYCTYHFAMGMVGSVTVK
ncbi:MAG TPA: plastocyanin/azurin family copper-binding protein [Armatimonadota bacterium]|jgi:plastocyanin